MEVYQATGNEKYGQAAKRLLLAIEPWGVDGPMSLLSPFGDEPALSMARFGHRAYDWLYPLFTDSEREPARKHTIDPDRHIYQRPPHPDYASITEQHPTT